MTANEALLFGSASPPARRWLRAGPLTLAFEAGDLRSIRLGDGEVIRRIYGAVRDRDWNTVPGAIDGLEAAELEDAFHIRYTSTHQHGDIDLIWEARIEGETDGSIAFTFDGQARSTFWRNRIGVCVLHPVRECAGARCRARYVDGSERELRFPDVIAAEQPVNGLSGLAGLAHEVSPRVWAELTFEGEVFEVEDQRNWIDASFKTYGTPLRFSFPVLVQAGTRVRQCLRLRLVGSEKAEGARTRRCVRTRLDPVKITIGNVVAPLPAMGLCATADAGRLDERSLRRLSALKLAHLRVDLRSENDDAGLVHAAGSFAEAVRLGCGVELAVHLDDNGDERQAGAFLDALAGVLKEAGVAVARVLVFGFGSGFCTSAAGLQIVRRHLGVFQAPVGGGSAADLYQFNLNRPPPDVDVVCWGMNPQVHAFDNGSIAETPEAAGQQVSSVGVYCPGKPRAVSPVTLKPRFNPVAQSYEQRDAPGELPATVDVRQMSLFGAAWTLAMLKALAEAGAENITFYETTGWRGVMEPASGSRLPGKFPSFAGSVFPLYHVLADAGEFAGGEVVVTQSSNSLEIASLFLRKGERRRLILANLCPEPREAELPKLGGVLRMRALDESSGLAAMTAPEEFRLQQGPFRDSRVALAPYAVMTLDFVEN